MDEIKSYVEKFGRKIIKTDLGLMGEWELNYLLDKNAVVWQGNALVIRTQLTGILRFKNGDTTINKILKDGLDKDDLYIKLKNLKSEVVATFGRDVGDFEMVVDFLPVNYTECLQVIKDYKTQREKEWLAKKSNTPPIESYDQDLG